MTADTLRRMNLVILSHPGWYQGLRKLVGLPGSGRWRVSVFIS